MKHISNEYKEDYLKENKDELMKEFILRYDKEWNAFVTECIDQDRG